MTPKINWEPIVIPTLQETPLGTIYKTKGIFTLGTGTWPELHKDIMEKPMELRQEKGTLGTLYTYKKLRPYIGLPGTIPIRAPTTYVGVEIELEGVHVKHSLGTWDITNDGSLKIEGAEFISVPIPFKYLEVELIRLFGTMSGSFASSRCSVHVHMNVRDFTLEELRNFILLYMIFEKSLFRVSGNRWDSNFCVPLFASPYDVKRVLNYIRTDNKLYEKWYKYFALNISPIFGGESTKIGTVEFRHMEGCKDTTRIINWVNLIVSLKVAAKELDYNEFLENLSSMNSTSSYIILARKVFKWLHTEIVGHPTFKEDIESCITQTKYVLSNKTNRCNIEINMSSKFKGL